MTGSAMDLKLNGHGIYFRSGAYRLATPKVPVESAVADQREEK
jgi:hypothetical protein